MKLAAMTISKNSIVSAIRGAFVADAASMVRKISNGIERSCS
jgi:hypothetical protein